jgi:hypothetical protein
MVLGKPLHLFFLPWICANSVVFLIFSTIAHTQLSPSGSKPPPLYGMTAFLHDKEMCIFGGMGDGGTGTKELYCYEPGEMRYIAAPLNYDQFIKLMSHMFL